MQLGDRFVTRGTHSNTSSSLLLAAAGRTYDDKLPKKTKGSSVTITIWATVMPRRCFGLSYMTSSTTNLPTDASAILQSQARGASLWVFSVTGSGVSSVFFSSAVSGAACSSTASLRLACFLRWLASLCSDLSVRSCWLRLRFCSLVPCAISYKRQVNQYNSYIHRQKTDRPTHAYLFQLCL